MYQYNLKFGRIDTFFLCYFNLKYLIDINTTIAIGVAGGIIRKTKRFPFFERGV